MKRGRILTFLGIILGLVTMLAAFYILRGSQQPVTTPTEVPKQKVLVVRQNVAQAEEIDPATAELQEFEKSQVPTDALVSPQELIGKLWARDIVAGTMLRQEMITDRASIVEKGINASFLIPAGKVAVAFPIDELSSVAYALQAGDTVDMLITIQVVNLDPSTQIKLPVPRTGNSVEGQVIGQQVPRMITQLTLQDVTVLKIGDWAQPNPQPKASATPTPAPAGGQQAGQQGQNANAAGPTIMTLLVDQQDALVLKFARESGATIDFALRGKNDHEIVTTEPLTLEYMIRRFNITPPEKLPYAIEMGGQPTRSSTSSSSSSSSGSSK
jgi:Flp pilus assembly protein CpaB